jgi:flagellar motor switch protein FliM
MTTKADSLSGEEVAALMAELGDTGLAIGGDTATASAGAVPFALGAETCRPAQKLAGLERIGERLARQLRDSIETYSRSKTQITAEPIEHRRFEEWCADQREFASVSLYRVRPLKGGLMIAMEADFITSLVDAFYGGRGTAPPHKRTEFTASEDRLIGRFTDMLIGQLKTAWADVMQIEPVLASRETNPSYVTIVKPQDTIVIQRFTLVPAQGRPGAVTFIYPQATLRPIEHQLSATVRDDSTPVDAEWRQRLAWAVEDVRLPVRSVLARPELTVAQLIALKPGDVIPINLAPKVPLLVGATRFAEGTIGEQEGRAALLVEAVGKGTER